MESAQKTSPPAEIGFAQVTMNIENKHAKKYIIYNNNNNYRYQCFLNLVKHFLF